MPRYQFSKRSKAELEGVHPSLVKLANALLDHYDIVVVDGKRSIAQQRKYVQKGVSKTMNSKHLPQEDGYSHALDLLPYPGFDYTLPGAERDLLLFGGFVLGIAASMDISLRYGGDWNSNQRNSDNRFQDLGHFELRPG